ncbi:MAG: class I SAM-dependent methyltransferase [Actinomycetota bacterium]
MSEDERVERPGLVARIRSRQSGHPSGVLGRFIGRAMVRATQAHNDRGLELLALGAPSTVLEIGYGQGRTAERLLDAGHRVLGADVSETVRRQATARNRAATRDGRARFAVGDGRLVPFDQDDADAAFCVHALYFMDDPATTLDEIGRVVRAGGRFVLCCHVGDDPIPAWADPTVYRIPPRHRIESMLTDAGFVLVHHEDDGPGDFPTHWFVAERRV